MCDLRNVRGRIFVEILGLNWYKNYIVSGPLNWLTLKHTSDFSKLTMIIFFYTFDFYMLNFVRKKITFLLRITTISTKMFFKIGFVNNVSF